MSKRVEDGFDEILKTAKAVDNKLAFFVACIGEAPGEGNVELSVGGAGKHNDMVKLMIALLGDTETAFFKEILTEALRLLDAGAKTTTVKKGFISKIKNKKGELN